MEFSLQRSHARLPHRPSVLLAVDSDRIHDPCANNGQRLTKQVCIDMAGMTSGRWQTDRRPTSSGVSQTRTDESRVLPSDISGYECILSHTT